MATTPQPEALPPIRMKLADLGKENRAGCIFSVETAKEFIEKMKTRNGSLYSEYSYKVARFGNSDATNLSINLDNACCTLGNFSIELSTKHEYSLWADVTPLAAVDDLMRDYLNEHVDTLEAFSLRALVQDKRVVVPITWDFIIPK